MANCVARACLVAVITLTAATPLAGAVAAAPQSGQAAVLFDPRLSRTEQVERAARAGAAIVRFGAAPGSLVVDMAETGGLEALRDAGAWLVADPIILGGCAPNNMGTLS